LTVDSSSAYPASPVGTAASITVSDHFDLAQDRVAEFIFPYWGMKSRVVVPASLQPMYLDGPVLQPYVMVNFIPPVSHYELGLSNHAWNKGPEALF
jgi:hypothetical protein